MYILFAKALQTGYSNVVQCNASLQTSIFLSMIITRNFLASACTTTSQVIDTNPLVSVIRTSSRVLGCACYVDVTEIGFHNYVPLLCSSSSSTHIMHVPRPPTRTHIRSFYPLSLSIFLSLFIYRAYMSYDIRVSVSARVSV